MYLAYVDESYDASEHWVAALLVEHRSVNDAHRGLRQVVATASREYGIPEDAELHGNELFGGKGVFAGLDPRIRIGIYAKALRAITECGCSIVLRGVAVPGLRARYGHDAEPQRWVVEHLLERVDEFCAPEDHALIVADEHELSRELLADLRQFQDQATRGYRARRIVNVVDTIHFVSSRTNHLVQAADLVVFLKRRLRTHVESDPRAARANEALWEILAPHVTHDRIWHP